MINATIHQKPIEFSRLPEEIHHHILTFLGPKDITLGIGLASKAFYRLGKDDALWKMQCAKANKVSLPLLKILSPRGRWKHVFVHPQTWNLAILQLWAKLSGCGNSDKMFPEETVVLKADNLSIQSFQSSDIIFELVKTLIGGPESYNNIQLKNQYNQGIKFSYSTDAMKMDITFWCVFLQENSSWILKNPNPPFAETRIDLTVIDDTGTIKHWDVLVKIHRLFHGYIINHNDWNYRVDRKDGDNQN